jgi:hypothetical protein
LARVRVARAKVAADEDYVWSVADERWRFWGLRLRILFCAYRVASLVAPPMMTVAAFAAIVPRFDGAPWWQILIMIYLLGFFVALGVGLHGFLVGAQAAVLLALAVLRERDDELDDDR